MIIVVEPGNADQHVGLLDQMFRLRAKIFADRLGWQVAVQDGRERDPFDALDPVYLLHTDRDAKVLIGSLRLLPTTGPTVLADFFADTMPDGARLSAPSIWECTRFCIDDAIGGLRAQTLASGSLIAGLGSLAIRAGIESIIGNFDASMLRLYRRIGCDVDVLGVTRRYGRPVYLGLFPVSEPILACVRSRLRAAAEDDDGLLPAAA